MNTIKVILFISAILIIIPLVLVFLLKLYGKLLNKITEKLERKNFYIRPVKNRTLSQIGKYLIEALVGITIFIICLRVFSLPIYFLQGTEWIPPLLIQILFIMIPLLYAVMITYKTLRFIHKHLEINGN